MERLVLPFQEFPFVSQNKEKPQGTWIILLTLYHLVSHFHSTHSPGVPLKRHIVDLHIQPYVTHNIYKYICQESRRSFTRDILLMKIHILTYPYHHVIQQIFNLRSSNKSQKTLKITFRPRIQNIFH